MKNRDIDRIIGWFSAHHPEVKVRQLEAAHLGDDDGLWFFRLGGIEVQVESSTGNFPFLIESSAHPRRTNGADFAEVTGTLAAELGLG